MRDVPRDPKTDVADMTQPTDERDACSAPSGESLSVYRSILTTTSTYSLSLLFLRFTSFLMMPILTRLLTTADYGILELLDLTLYVFGALVGVQLGQALFYFYSSSEDDQRTTVSSAMAGSIVLGIGIIGLLLGYVLSPVCSRLVLGTPQYTTLFQLAFGNLGVGVVIETGLSWLRVRNLARPYVVLSIGRNLLSAALSVFFLMRLHQGVASIQWGALLSGIPLALYVCVHVFRENGFGISVRALWKQTKYAAPLSISGALMLVLHYGDRFFLVRTVSLSDIGIYSVAYKLGMIITMVQNPFMLFWGSQMFRLVQEPKGDRLYIRISTYLLFVVTFVAVALSLFVQPLLRLMAAPAFSGAAAYVPVLAVAYVLRALGDHVRSVFNLEDRTEKHLTCNLVSAGACLALYATLIPRYGVWGAVLSTLGGFIVFLLIGLWEAQRIRYFALEYRRYFHLAICSGLCIAAGKLVPVRDWWLQVAWGVVLLVMWLLLLATTGFFDRAERRYAIDALMLLRRRLRLA